MGAPCIYLLALALVSSSQREGAPFHPGRTGLVSIAEPLGRQCRMRRRLPVGRRARSRGCCRELPQRSPLRGAGGVTGPAMRGVGIEPTVSAWKADRLPLPQPRSDAGCGSRTHGPWMATTCVASYTNPARYWVGRIRTGGRVLQAPSVMTDYTTTQLGTPDSNRYKVTPSHRCCRYISPHRIGGGGFEPPLR